MTEIKDDNSPGAAPTESSDQPGQEDAADRGEGKMSGRTPGKAEGERRDSDAAARTADEIADAADEAGSAFLPFDKVLSDPKNR